MSRAHDLSDIVAACARIETDLDGRFAGEEVNVVTNYSGGTTTMSAGLVALALRRGWDTELTERPVHPWSGPITRASLSGVTVFEDLDVTCSPGINVFIGENGTGKTHLLKCMYAVLRAAEEGDAKPRAQSWGDKLKGVLMGHYRSAFAGVDDPTEIIVECERARFERRESAVGQVKSVRTPFVKVRALFLPSREVLQMYRGFVPLYEERDLPFDETHYDICKELGQLELREPSRALAGVLAELESMIGGRVRLDFNSFVIDTASIGTISASMVAEGHRKLAVLAYLIKSGALIEESVLFWDEPEANLNPKLIAKVAGLLHRIAKAGVQVFVATHDDLLAGELSLAAEHRIEPVADTLFFSLHRASGADPVEVEVARRWGDLKPNAIVEAYAAHYDREHELFARDPGEPSP